jgi:hypothetical protein
MARDARADRRRSADKILEQRSELLREAAKRMETLIAFDHFSANSGVKLSPELAGALMSQGTAALAKLRDASEWQAARDQLLADPQAEISIERAS